MDLMHMWNEMGYIAKSIAVTPCARAWRTILTWERFAARGSCVPWSS